MIRCNAGHKTGYGHISRCLALAFALRKLGAIEICFVLDCADAVEQVTKFGFHYYILNTQQDESFCQLVAEKKPNILILDVRPHHSLSIFPSIKSNIQFLVDIDDISDQRFEADVVYLPPAPVVERLHWDNFKQVKRIGFKWILTGATFTPPAYRKPVPPYRLLLTMGGSDPWDYTRKYAPLFAEACQQENIHFGLVIGPGFKQRDELIKFCQNLAGNPVIFDNPNEMGSVYDWCDFALVTTSVSACELAISCKKCLYLCPDEKYREYGLIFERAGLGKILTLPDQSPSFSVQEQLRLFIQTFDKTPFTPDTVKTLFPCNPAQLIATDILTLWKQKIKQTR